jgi:hypothetical protein
MTRNADLLRESSFLLRAFVLSLSVINFCEWQRREIQFVTAV